MCVAIVLLAILMRLRETKKREEEENWVRWNVTACFHRLGATIEGPRIASWAAIGSIRSTNLLFTEAVI